MKKNLSLFTYYSFLLLTFLPLPVLAISGTDNTGDPASLKNPLKQDHIVCLLQDLLDVVMIFAVPIIVFMIIYAGFLFVMDRGSEKTLAQAKRALLYAVIGGVIILGATAIFAVIEGTVNTFRENPESGQICPN